MPLVNSKEMFKKAVEENPEGRYSIYDVSGCEDCGESFDEGIIFNENWEEYK